MVDKKSKLNPFTGELQKILDENDLIPIEDKEALELNIMLNAFDVAILDSQVELNMVDGMRDVYEDESGIDTGSSVNQSYDPTNDLYSPNAPTGDLSLLLNFNGSDGATSTTDDSPSGHTINFNGDAQLDTSEKKFGSASLLLDGTGDFLDIADSSDWDFFGSNSDSRTIDFWVYLAIGSKTSQIFLSHRANSNTLWLFSFGNGPLSLDVLNGGATVISFSTSGGTNLTRGAWHHVAICKVANEYGIYLDGEQTGYVQDNDTFNITGPLRIGASDGVTNDFLDGWMDSLRFTTDNLFSAAPNSGKTDTITVPTAEPTTAVQNMTLISETFTADSAPTEARIVLSEEDLESITLNTDLNAFVSRDNGTTFSQVTLTEEITLPSDKRLLTGTVDISGQPSGTSMIYKITTLNNKNLNIHATGMLWN